MCDHGGGEYVVMGEDTFVELVSSMRTHFPLVPHADIDEAVRRLQALNDFYTEMLDLTPDEEASGG